DNEEEGWRYTQGDKNARRPPELLTRDHVARCIVREIKEGRGTPHGGVYLDISWIRKRLSNAEEHIKRKLPSMHHQFKALGKIDNDQVDRYTREALKPFDNSHGENPYSVQRDLQEVMQHNVGIVRDESEMQSALDHSKTFWERAAQVGVTGNRDFNPGWHTAL